MKDRLWPQAAERERAEAQKWVSDLRDLEAQRNPPRPDHGVRMVMLDEPAKPIFSAAQACSTSARSKSAAGTV